MKGGGGGGGNSAWTAPGRGGGVAAPAHGAEAGSDAAVLGERGKAALSNGVRGVWVIEAKLHFWVGTSTNGSPVCITH
jgi:hypothetical protein